MPLPVCSHDQRLVCDVIGVLLWRLNEESGRPTPVLSFYHTFQSLVNAAGQNQRLSTLTAHLTYEIRHLLTQKRKKARKSDTMNSPGLYLQHFYQHIYYK